MEQKNKTNQKAWKLQNMKVLFETWTLIPQSIFLLHPPFPYFSSDFQMLYEKDEKNLKSSALDWKLLSFSLPQDIFDSNKLHEKSIWDILIFSLSWPIIVSFFNTLWEWQCSKWIFEAPRIHVAQTQLLTGKIQVIAHTERHGAFCCVV